MATYVASGAVAAANNAAVTPALPAGIAAGDLLCCFAQAGSGTAPPSFTAPGGPWAEAFKANATSRSNALWYTIATGADTAPVVGFSGGIDQQPVAAVCFAFRPATGKTLALESVSASSPNPDQLNIGPTSVPVPAIASTAGVVLFLGGKNDDFTSVATLTGDGLTWVEFLESTITTWNDLGIVGDYALYASTPTITAKTFTVTGGTATLGLSRSLSFAEVDLTPSFVGAGATTAANNAAITPAIPAGVVADDLICALAYGRSSGTFTDPPGWQKAANTAATERAYGLWYKTATGSDTAPTITVSGGVDQQPIIGLCFAFRPRVGKSLVLESTGTSSPNPSAANIGPVAPPTIASASGIVIEFGARNDDFTSVATLTGDGLTWSQIAAASTTTWNDAGIVVDYALYASTPTITDKTFVVTGGAAATGIGRSFAFKEVAPVAGSSVAVMSDFVATQDGSTTNPSEMSAFWPDFSVDATATHPVTGSAALTWPAWTATSDATHPVIGDLAAAWSAFSGSYASGAIALGSVSATWDAWSVESTASASGVSAIADSVAAIAAWTVAQDAVAVAGGNSAALLDDWTVDAAAGRASSSDYAASWEEWAAQNVALVIQPTQIPERIEPDGTDLSWIIEQTGDEIFADMAIDRRGTPVLSSALRTAIILSLGSDARADTADVIPDGSGDRRGWWGNAFPPPDIADDNFGSRLWLLSREKQTEPTRRRAEEYGRQALEWLVADGIASSVSVSATFPQPGWLQLDATITRPASPPVTFRYATAWAAQERYGNN